MIPTFSQASCKGLLDLFFDERPDSVSVAKALCHTCPHTTDCLRGAIERCEAYGVWGGTDYYDRRIIAAGLGVKPPTRRAEFEHGTPKGFARHNREGIPIDLDRNGKDICGCLSAYRENARIRVARYRKRKRATPS